MKQKLFTLLTLALFFCSGAWADDPVYHQFSNGDILKLSTTNFDAAVTAGYIVKGSSMSGSTSVTAGIDPNTDATPASESDYKSSFTVYKVKDKASNKHFRIYITGIDKVKIYAYAGGTSRKLNVYINGSATAKEIINFSTSGSKSGEFTLPSTGDNYFDVEGTNDMYPYAIKFSLDPRTATTLSFNKTNIAGYVGDDVVEPTLTVSPAAASSSVNYTSSNTDVAVVNSTTGALTLKAIGTTTITAAITDDATYKDASASYTLSVVALQTPITLINYPSSTDGITAKGVSETTIKIHENTDAVPCYSFSSTYSASNNYIKLSTTGGFKAGDVVTIAGAYNNSSSKTTTVVIFDTDGETITSIYSGFSNFINGRSSADDPTEGTYTLTSDYTNLYIGRNGNTTTGLTKVTVTRPAYNVKVTSAGWASFSSNKELKIADGLTAYYVGEVDGGKTSVKMKEITGGYIPANEGVVLSAEEGVYQMPVTSTDAAIGETNYLVKWLTEGTPSAATYYTLGINGSGDPVFKLSTGGTLAANKAYLDISGISSHELFVTFEDGGSTGIADLESQKFNASGDFYNLNGQKVANPTKGLYIVNGKKVIIK